METAHLRAGAAIAGGGWSASFFWDHRPAGALFIPSARAITYQGPGVLTLGATNTYSGATTLSAGTVKLGIGNAFPGASVVSINSGATLDLGSNSVAIAGLNDGASGTGMVDNSVGTGTYTLTVGNTTGDSFSGIITNSSGAVGLTKNGSGSLTLSGANGYSCVFGPMLDYGTLVKGGTHTMALRTNIASALNLSVPITVNGGTLSAGGMPNVLLNTGVSSASALEFSCFGYYDYLSPTLASPLQLNTWYHLAVSSDGTSLHFYVNGSDVGDVLYSSSPNSPPYWGTTGGTMNLGNDLDGTYGFVSEQFMGRLDEVAIYNQAVSQSDLYSHYEATLPVQPLAQSVQADFQTNYVSRTTTLFVSAAGQALQYQWYCQGLPVAGATSSALVLSPLDLSSNAATFTVGITNGLNHTSYTNPPGLTMTVLPIPTSAIQLDLISGLVLHLPLTSNPADISGRNNNGANVGAPVYVSDSQALGGGALQFSSGGGNGYNYVNLGTPSDLYFGAGQDFTVSFWINQSYTTVQTNVPWIGNAIGGIANAGVCFVPGLSSTYSANGAPEWSIMDTLGHNIAVSGANGSVGNAAWHNVAGVFTRASIGQIYVDGNLVSQQAIFAVGDWGNLATMKWTIGQDPSGVYGGDTASATTGEISDVGMWRRALSPVELAGIYLAGSQNTPAVTFAPVVVPAASVTISNIVNNLNGTVTINYGGGAGSQFILVKSAIVPTATGNRDNWTPVLTNTASPGSFTTPLSGTEFYSIESK